MGIIDKFTGGVVKEVASGLDNLFTSDEERLEARNAFAGINAKIVESGNALRTTIEGAVSKRHEIDMMSDSWLSKNIRPMTLVTMVVFTLGFVLFVSPEAGVGMDAYATKLELLSGLDMLIFGFYFGSRGFEKVAASMTAVLVRPKKKKAVEDEEEDW